MYGYRYEEDEEPGYGYGYADEEFDPDDPQADPYYQQPVEAAYVPDLVCDFLKLLKKAIAERNVFEIQNLYENTFVTLTEKHFQKTPWPSEHEVVSVITTTEKDKIFLILYKELYYRHIYAKCQPTVENRFESYYNYCHLFNYILSAEAPVPLELPNQWLWDIIDEFIYQFQSFSLFRTRINKLSEVDLEQLSQNPKVWNVHSVLNVLHSLVDKSNINEQLKEVNANRDPYAVTGVFGRQPLYQTLGYYALIGLLRLHSLLGDYYQAIKVLENIDLNRTQVFPVARILACQMTTFYYVGFAYMMMRRYSDAIRTFSNMLVYLQRTRHIFPVHRTLQAEMIEKQTDQMYRLLTICLVLQPQRIDESVASVLQEKNAEVMIKLQRGEIDEYQNSFRFACPKFVSPVSGMYENNFSRGGERIEPWRQQLEVFMKEVHQHLPILTIRSYLKLYTTMPISKLAAFMDKTEEETRAYLLCFKHKMQNLVWTGKTDSIGGLEGEFQTGSDVDFYIDKDMIHIADTKVARRYGDYFLRQIHKFEELYRHVSSLQIT